MTIDIKAKISLTGKTHAVRSGYRPTHRLVLSDGTEYSTTGVHQYLGQEYLHPNESLVGTISFITPEYYPHCLAVGDIIPIQEGARVVGKAEVLEIYNKLLEK